MITPKLFMFLLGASIPGRHIEQHDIFFGIGEHPAGLVSEILEFWPGHQKIHVDGWREITRVDKSSIKVVLKSSSEGMSQSEHLFFINLGGYKPDEFDEFHFKVLTVATTQSEAIKKAMNSPFYKHTGFDGAPSHVDNKYGLDVDELYNVLDILPAGAKEKYAIHITTSESEKQDELHLGYFKLEALPTY